MDNDIANIGGIYLWGVREKLVSENPCDQSRQHGRLDRLSVDPPIKPTFTVEQYSLLVEAVDSAGDSLTRDMIVVFANTGLRFEELAHLTPECLLWTDGHPLIDVRARNGWSPKDPGEVKQIPMLPEVEGILRRRANACPSGQSYLFGNPIQSKHATPGSQQDERVNGEPARRRLKKYLTQVGIEPSRDMLWYAFRRFFVKKCVERNVPLNVIMSWTGHDTMTMALHYARDVRREESSREIDRLLG